MDNVFDDITETITGEKAKLINHIVFIMDHSGSMNGTQEESKEGFNSHIKKLKDETYDQLDLITLIEFDQNIKEVYFDKNVQDVENIRNYWIGGTTSLYDAIGYSIGKIDQIPNINEHSILFIIITDGHENTSKEYNSISIKELIDNKEKEDNWTFTFVGANQNVFETAVNRMGFSLGNTSTYDSTKYGTTSVHEMIGDSILRYKSYRSDGARKVENFYNMDENMDEKYEEKY